MKIDTARLQNYLLDIKSRTIEIEKLLSNNNNEQILSDPWLIRGLKYLLIEIAEIMANTLTHIITRDKGQTVTGYVDTIIKAGDLSIISESLSKKLKPFFDFRNSIIHRYWIISDEKLLLLTRENHKDFELFIDEIKIFMQK
ncbi:MAG: hypothetical protein A2Y62_09715 [Candidatus Fischerbacteria bacterium RBG_13_37_8]|uniref:DUF86 domain-containing protein n=1 Tax=Candidatus Fischerbacteria bacterium RBG_13_37_8 TaxID=1817863 RepID=A0A1F5V5T3_9BACT|nr:MAG: hypothetical protein A2Y62_09715 [Candidatus Fischerbacteria bacterium RBG_13_37_8]